MTAPDEPSAQSLLEARGLARRSRQGTWLLRDVSATVRPGDRVAIQGPTGSGKTLLLRALARLDPVDAGVVLWKGLPVAGDRVPRFRTRAIYLHQRPAPFEGTVETSLRLPLRLACHRGTRFDRDRVVSYLNSLGRDATFLDRNIRELSGGEAQMAALLRAVQLDPDILLLDEPTASLDRDSAQAIERLLEAWYTSASATRAFVWVTHDPDQAKRVAALGWFMRAGQLTLER